MLKFFNPSPIFPTRFFAPSVILAPRSVTFFWIGTASLVSFAADWLGSCIGKSVDFLMFCRVWFIPSSSSDCANTEIVSAVIEGIPLTLSKISYCITIYYSFKFCFDIKIFNLIVSVCCIRKFLLNYHL